MGLLAFNIFAFVLNLAVAIKFDTFDINSFASGLSLGVAAWLALKEVGL